MALPNFHVGEKAARRLKKLSSVASVVSAAFLYMFPIGAIAMGLGYVAYLKPGQEYPNQSRRLKRVRTFMEDHGELTHRGLEATKSPWVSVPLAATALLVGVVPFLSFYVPTVVSTISYGVAHALAAPVAILAIPASIHHFRALKRAQERKEGHPIRAYEVKKGERSIGEHVLAEVGDGVALTKWSVNKVVGGVQNVGRLAGWTGRTWKKSWATSPAVRLGGKALESSLKHLGTGARFVGHAVTLHHYRQLKAEVVELRAKVAEAPTSKAPQAEAPQAEVVTAERPKSGLRKIKGKRTTVTVAKETRRRERKLED